MRCTLAAPSGAVVAVHRTWLHPNGSGEAPVEPTKMTLGPIRSGAIRLAPVASRMAVAEGIETALAVTQPTGIAAWAALSAVGLRLVALPHEVREIVVCADGDEAGQQAALAAARRFRGEGRIASVTSAPDGKDFADLLVEGVP